MKIKNIFKKGKKEVKSSNIQKMDKKQLEKVIGGVDTKTTTTKPTTGTLSGGAGAAAASYA